MNQKPILVRAFELADSGRLKTIKPLRQTLQSEGYSYVQIASELSGKSIQRDLKIRIAAANASARD